MNRSLRVTVALGAFAWAGATAAHPHPAEAAQADLAVLAWFGIMLLLGCLRLWDMHRARRRRIGPVESRENTKPAGTQTPDVWDPRK